MSICKQLLLGAYYYGTCIPRARHNARLRAQRRAPAIVLFYHRIADEHPNPWTASRFVFVKQIHWLKRHFDMVSISIAE